MAHILVIDDEPMLRSLLKEALEGAGHEVVTAADGAEGVELFNARPADLVITDLIMPEKEGIEVVLELKQGRTKPKIIAVSGGGACGPVAYLRAAHGLGADRTLQKPFRLPELMEAVDELLAEAEPTP